MDEKKGERKVPRLYRLPINVVAELDRYALENGIPKKEVVEMAIKEFLKKNGAGLLAGTFLVLALSDSAWALTTQDLTTRIGNLVKAVAAIVGTPIIAYHLISGVIDRRKGDPGSGEHFKDAAIAGVSVILAWGLAEWMTGIFMGSGF